MLTAILTDPSDAHSARRVCLVMKGTSDNGK